MSDNYVASSGGLWHGEFVIWQFNRRTSSRLWHVASARMSTQIIGRLWALLLLHINIQYIHSLSLCWPTLVTLSLQASISVVQTTRSPITSDAAGKGKGYNVECNAKTVRFWLV